MKILFLTHYFAPEGNAPANRVAAMCRRWVEAGHEVTVITCAPNVPTGIVYDGYRNRLFQSEIIDGIKVKRVWTYIAANEGTIKRIANYLSYMAMTVLRAMFMRRPDVVIATSPQFFCGWAGVWVKRLKRVPLILEIRDLWPESIVAVGAMKNGRLLRFLEWLEHRMYRAATHLVTVGEGYQTRLIEKNVPPQKIDIISNGVDRDVFSPQAPDPDLRDQYQLHGKFVCSYVGTIGMACGLSVVLRAAEKLKADGRNDVVYLLVGDGAARADLEAQAKEKQLDNVVFTGRQPRERMAAYLATSDCCLVHLADTELFATVMPSKIFEMLAMQRPIILGVRGVAADLLKRSGGGVCIAPDDADELIQATLKMAKDAPARQAMGQVGHDFVLKHFDRDQLAQDYLELLQRFTKLR